MWKIVGAGLILQVDFCVEEGKKQWEVIDLSVWAKL